MPLKGTFPYYSDGVAGEKYGAGNYKATNGRLYKVSTSDAGTPLAWYPAPGYRGSTSGALDCVGIEGSVWSASSNGAYGVCLRFVMNAAQPDHSNYRALGLPLRCLSEETRNACDSKNRTGRSSSPFTTPILSGSGRALPGWAERPSAQARRPCGSQEKSPFTTSVLRNSSSARLCEP